MQNSFFGRQAKTKRLKHLAHFYDCSTTTIQAERETDKCFYWCHSRFYDMLQVSQFAAGWVVPGCANKVRVQPLEETMAK